jgi:hypothetical protein
MPLGKLIDARIELRGPQPFYRLSGRPHFEHVGRTLDQGSGA